MTEDQTPYTHPRKVWFIKFMNICEERSVAYGRIIQLFESNRKNNLSTIEEIFDATRKCSDIIAVTLKELDSSEFLKNFQTYKYIEHFKTRRGIYRISETYYPCWDDPADPTMICTSRERQYERTKDKLPCGVLTGLAFTTTLLQDFRSLHQEFYVRKQQAQENGKPESAYTFSRVYKWRLNYIRVRFTDFVRVLIRNGTNELMETFDPESEGVTNGRTDMPGYDENMKKRVSSVMEQLILMCKLVDLSGSNLYMQHIGWKYGKRSDIRPYEFRLCSVLLYKMGYTLNFFQACRETTACPDDFSYKVYLSSAQTVRFRNAMTTACSSTVAVVCSVNVQTTSAELITKKNSMLQLLENEKNNIIYGVETLQVNFKGGKYFKDIWPKAVRKQLHERANYLGRVRHSLQKIEFVSDRVLVAQYTSSGTLWKYSRVQIWIIEYLCACLMRLLYFHILKNGNEVDEGKIMLMLQRALEWWKQATSYHAFGIFQRKRTARHIDTGYHANYSRKRAGGLSFALDDGELWDDLPDPSAEEAESGPTEAASGPNGPNADEEGPSTEPTEARYAPPGYEWPYSNKKRNKYKKISTTELQKRREAEKKIVSETEKVVQKLNHDVKTQVQRQMEEDTKKRLAAAAENQRYVEERMERLRKLEAEEERKVAEAQEADRDRLRWVYEEYKHLHNKQYTRGKGQQPPEETPLERRERLEEARKHREEAAERAAKQAAYRLTPEYKRAQEEKERLEDEGIARSSREQAALREARRPEREAREKEEKARLAKIKQQREKSDKLKAAKIDARRKQTRSSSPKRTPTNPTLPAFPPPPSSFGDPPAAGARDRGRSRSRGAHQARSPSFEPRSPSQGPPLSPKRRIVKARRTKTAQ